MGQDMAHIAEAHELTKPGHSVLKFWMLTRPTKKDTGKTQKIVNALFRASVACHKPKACVERTKHRPRLPNL